MDVSAISSLASTGELPGSFSLRGLQNKSPEAQRTAVAGQFEAILLRQFLSKSVGSMMGGENSAQGSIYGYLLTDTLAQSMAAGGGLGMAKIIEQQLSPRGQPAAAAAAKGNS
ncbi:MAG TPA: flagellar biosynthesis protein FlgJ [Opitutaceae bacterium]|jgi:Rod binding domain-containing protein|nr:flagellar biosynthesis protein FlgJ [Opitutaceae bacterium]